MSTTHRNLVSHRISYDRLAGLGAIAGLLAAVVMGALTVAITPLVAPGADVWSFFKVVSTMILGEGAATPLAGFAAGPVLLGVALHLAIGAAFGAIFAILIGLFDIEETVPIMLMGLVYGVIVFLGTYLVIAQLLFPAFEQLPFIVPFWTHVAFGLIAGAVLGSWADRYDLDHGRDAERVREHVHPTDAAT